MWGDNEGWEVVGYGWVCRGGVDGVYCCGTVRMCGGRRGRYSPAMVVRV
jgi:hypothetical protein